MSPPSNLARLHPWLLWRGAPVAIRRQLRVTNLPWSDILGLDLAV